MFKHINFLLALGLVVLLAACQRQPTSTAEVPRLISQGYKISVAPFTQPLNTGQLITGHIPEDQGKIPQDALEALDRKLREVLLTSTKRQYVFIPRQNIARDMTVSHSSGQPSALGRWVAYGKKHNVQLLLIPQILDWHERAGSEAGVTDSAHVRAEFYLVNIPESMVGNRSVFEEKQVGLAENLLTMGEFIKRKGQWVTAEDLTVDGMQKAVKDLGL